MKKIRYEEYATDLIIQLGRFQIVSLYEWKFEFTKDGADRRIASGVLYDIFKRYMHNDIRVIWE